MFVDAAAEVETRPQFHFSCEVVSLGGHTEGRAGVRASLDSVHDTCYKTQSLSTSYVNSSVT